MNFVFWRDLTDAIIKDLICLHGCKFRASGSDLKYTHIHILKKNADEVAALGHDDHTNPSDGGHCTISKSGDWYAEGDDCQIQGEDEFSLSLRKKGYLLTIYFHASGQDEDCPEGFFRVKCDCPRSGKGTGEVWFCYTLDHKIFERWYEEQKWDNRFGRYEITRINTAIVNSGKVGPVDCGSSIVIYDFETQIVQNCAGFDGLADGENTLIKAVRAKLKTAADRISCKDNCRKTVKETFKGWRCSQDSSGKFLLADATVQWTIQCAKP